MTGVGRGVLFRDCRLGKKTILTACFILFEFKVKYIFVGSPGSSSNFQVNNSDL